MPLYSKTATQLSELLQQKKCSSTEIVQSIYDRIDQVEDTVGAYITQTRQQAFDKAKKLDNERSNGKFTALSGIPIAYKDNFSTKGVATTCASKMLQNYIPPFNATVVDKLENAGTIMLGKLNMDEFAMGSSGETSYFKVTRNPVNTECVPGGSSSGSAAALAAGECTIALGSDTGGSARLPAAYCGVVGLKPTYGTISRYGAVAFASSLDVVCPMARCVEDTALILSQITGYDPMDSTCCNRTYVDFAANLSGGVRGKVIGIPAEYFGEGVDKEVASSVRAAAAMLESEGATVKEISLPFSKYALSAYFILSSAEAASNLARIDGVRYGFRAANYSSPDDLYEKSRTEGFGVEVKRRIMLGTNILHAGYYDDYYNRAKKLQKEIAFEFQQIFEKFDLLITPTAPTAAIKIGESVTDRKKMYAMDICTVAINLAGLPAISVPCGKAANGLPIGMQIIGAKFSEQNLLQTAYHYQQLVGGFSHLADIKLKMEGK